MKLIPTQYEANDGLHQYRFTHTKQGWSVARWRANQPQIPPTGEILAEEGYVPILSQYDAKFFNTIEEAEFQCRLAKSVANAKGD